MSKIKEWQAGYLDGLKRALDVALMAEDLHDSPITTIKDEIIHFATEDKL